MSSISWPRETINGKSQSRFTKMEIQIVPWCDDDDDDHCYHKVEKEHTE